MYNDSITIFFKINIIFASLLINLMKLPVKIKMNAHLFLRDPEESETGRKIIKHSIILIHKYGFEAFTFKKLAKAAVTTEAVVYRYFENKHRLLMYIVSWFWSWQEYLVMFHTNNINEPEKKLKKIIQILAAQVKDDSTTEHVDERLLYEIVMREGAKAYLTRHVSEDNKHHLFKPYQDLCTRVAEVILECNPKYKFPRSLSSTIIEMSHIQNFFMKYLPSLSDFTDIKDEAATFNYVKRLVFSAIAENLSAKQGSVVAK